MKREKSAGKLGRRQLGAARTLKFLQSKIGKKELAKLMNAIPEHPVSAEDMLKELTVMEIKILYEKGIDSYERLLHFCGNEEATINRLIGNEKRKLILKYAYFGTIGGYGKDLPWGCINKKGEKNTEIFGRRDWHNRSEPAESVGGA